MAKNLFHEYDVVRVTKLLKPERDFMGSEDTKRPPRVGDIGTIVDIPEGSSDYYVVECVDSDEGSWGATLWLADFVSDELELVEAAK
ncbi:MAG TPA: hypothetical protein VIV15_10095 [Anaerolineales bacterium]